MDGLRERGLVGASGRFTDAGRAIKGRIESLTDALAEAPYSGLEPLELDQLIALLEPISGSSGPRDRGRSLRADRWPPPACFPPRRVAEIQQSYADEPRPI
jgi:hypothetical protein